ncbi:hypothetical protein OLM90_17165 [Pseudomonas aeruginosa]|uniref:hypothetical protein n=1 Tax=Pseudomonas aeruginosa TaxID=287 RepID=UPI00249911E5|nr:hypothetical protein [Pseudomonas aeruginosa]MDI2516721.1 hypothetical protein [Pseudomonas aeruginosa]MDI2529070.1 hypothetical protein [Pseudomonas aeruginosa]
MTDINKLRELAVRALPFAPGEWFVENGIDQVRDCANDFVCETGEDDPIKASFIAAANPQAILKLIAEVERLRIGLKGDFDLDAWLEWTREKDRIKAQNDALQGALHAVQAEVDGNLRPLTRDLVNMVSGLNNGTHPNDIYEHCDEIERITGAALKGATQ